MEELKYVYQADMNGKRKNEMLHWALGENGVLYVSGEGAIPNFNNTERIAPWKEYQKNVTEVVIEEGVTEIGSNAFAGYETLERITLPITMERVSYAAFAGCTNLERVNVAKDFKLVHIYEPDKENEEEETDVLVIKMGLHAFSGTKYAVETWGDFYLYDELIVDYFGTKDVVQIPEQVRKIGMMAFCGCKIQEVILPEGFLSVASFAFAQTTLKKITLPEGVKIGYGAFSDILGEVEIETSSNLSKKGLPLVNENAFMDTKITLAGKKKLPDIYKLELKPEPEIKGYSRLRIKREEVYIGNENFNAGSSILRRIERGSRVYCITYEPIEKIVISVDCYAWDTERDLPKKCCVTLESDWVKNEEVVRIQDIVEETMEKNVFLELFQNDSAQYLYENGLIRREPSCGKEEWYWSKKGQEDEVAAASKILYQWMKKHGEYWAKRQ